MSEISPLRRKLDETTAETGLSMKALTVMAHQNDPFRIDGEAGHRDGVWLAMQVAQLLEPDRKIHLRGLHYVLVTHAPIRPDGEPYRNTDKWKMIGLCRKLHIDHDVGGDRKGQY